MAVSLRFFFFFPVCPVLLITLQGLHLRHTREIATTKHSNEDGSLIYEVFSMMPEDLFLPLAGPRTGLEKTTKIVILVYRAQLGVYFLI